MKKLFFITLSIFVSASSFAQFYVSAGGGYSTAMAEQVLGTSVVQTPTTVTSTNNYGSYGEGMNLKLNAGYFFNENLGFDLGFTYLMGPVQDVNTHTYAAAGVTVSQTAKATAIGVAPTLVYKWNNGLYGRFGFATKVGGQVEVDIYDKRPYAAAPTTHYTETKAKAEVNGKMPFGFTGAMGYEYKLNEKMGLFVEAEYLGINVKRDKMVMNEFDTSLYLNNGTLVQGGVYTISNLPAGYYKEITFVDERTAASPASEQLSSYSPYSSFGVNFGIRYSLGK